MDATQCSKATNERSGARYRRRRELTPWTERMSTVYRTAWAGPEVVSGRVMSLVMLETTPQAQV